MPIMNRPKTHSAVRLSRFFLGPDRPLGLAAGTLARPCALYGVCARRIMWRSCSAAAAST